MKLNSVPALYRLFVYSVLFTGYFLSSSLLGTRQSCIPWPSCSYVGLCDRFWPLSCEWKGPLSAPGWALNGQSEIVPHCLFLLAWDQPLWGLWVTTRSRALCLPAIDTDRAWVESNPCHDKPLEWGACCLHSITWFRPTDKHPRVILVQPAWHWTDLKEPLPRWHFRCFPNLNVFGFGSRLLAINHW